MHPLTHASATLRSALGAVERWFLAEVDPRVYALLRIGYAFSAFLIFLDFWPVRHVLLASTGLFGGVAPDAPAALNVFLLSGSEGFVTAVFVMTGIAIVTLGLGILPRLSAALVYLWAVSFSQTTPIALSGFDGILRIVGLVLVVSPSVQAYAVGPAALRGSSGTPARYGLRLVQWQLMLIYVTTVWLKAPDEFWRRGEAVTYFMMSIFARAPSPAAANHEVLGALATYGTLIFEAAIPFLLWMRRTRWLGVLLGVLLHVGIAMVSRLELFTVAILAMYPAFLEGEDVDTARDALRSLLPGGRSASSEQRTLPDPPPVT